MAEILKNRNHRCHIPAELFNEILKEKLGHDQNMIKAAQRFDQLGEKIDRVGKLLQNLPDNAVVRPKQSWLNIFGIK